MRLPVSRRHRERFTPPRYDHLDGPAPVYLIAVPTTRDVIAWRREIEAAGARFYDQDRLRAALRQGVREVVAEDQHDELLEILDRYEARLKARAEGEEEDPGDADLDSQVEQIEDFVRRHHQPYREMLGDQAAWLEYAPVIACEMFLAGWEGLDAEFRTGGGGRIDPDRLERAVPREDQIAIGYKAMAMMHPSAAQKKS